VGFFESLLEDQAHVLRMSVDASGEPTGYVWAQDQERPGSAFTKPARTMYIHHVAVAPEARGQGVGKSLVAAIESEARERGISRLALDHWTFNETARQFFTHLGFEPYNVRMRRELDVEAPSVR
jgi:GNAT superfamily N-acetyltransferase